MTLTAKKVYAILKRQISDMEAKLNSPVRYRGTVATADLLPLNPDIGDMYNIESKSIYGEAGMNVAWNGVVWDTMGAPIDMSLYIKSNELADWVKQQNKPTYTAEEVGALPADTKIPSKTSDLQNDSGFLTKIPDNYISGTDKTLSAYGKAADAKATGDKITELSADISNKLNKNQGSENSGKIAGINESGDIVPMFPVSVDYNEETNCLEFGSDQKMELNQGIGLDSTLTKTGYAADAGVVGEITNSLKEDISNKITKFYASNQGKTHLADSGNGKIMDMVMYGRSEQKQYSGKNLLNPTLQTTTRNGVTCTANGDGTYTLNGTATATGIFILHSNIDFTGQMRLCGGTSLVSLQYSNSSNFAYEDKGAGIIIEHFDSVTYPNASFNILIKADNVYNNALIKPMITTDLTATYDDFEPYTGGIPSPSPDYPQEIKSVVNPIVKVCGKNLFNKESPEKSGYIITQNGTVEESEGFNVYIYKYIDKPYTISYKKGNSFDTFRYGIESNGIITRKNASISPFTVKLNKGERLYLSPHTNESVVYDIQIELGSTPTTFEPYHEQTVTLPYTLNAIPVNSDGNITIDGQQYVADYVDVERGKLVRMVDSSKLDNTQSIVDKTEWLLAEPQEIDLTPEEIAAFKALATYYPTTNISVNSEQLDGYTVFNYPINMANGWNYVKQQIGDTREYIYDIDARTQDTDLQAAEAYVNSEYAVALTELEV